MSGLICGGKPPHISFMRRRPLHRLWIVLALLFLAEAWPWDHLEPVVARAVSIFPWG
jgi:hypothetical protein